MKTLIACVATLGLTIPLAAQSRTTVASGDTPSLSLRPFVMAIGERFSAKTTFEATFGESFEPFWGGGLQLALRDGLFVEVSASRFKTTGQRAFLNNGQIFRLGIPLTATLTPFEVTGGYRFRFQKYPRIVPYAGAGVGSYGYKETSDLSEASENVDTRHSGYLAVGGAEFRLHRWVGVGVDAQYTHVPGIFGAGGLSKDAGEKDLGGIAARLRVIVGR